MTPRETATHALKHVTLGDANEGQHLVDVGEPEDTRDNRVLAGERLKT